MAAAPATSHRVEQTALRLSALVFVRPWATGVRLAGLAQTESSYFIEPLRKTDCLKSPTGP